MVYCKTYTDKIENIQTFFNYFNYRCGFHPADYNESRNTHNIFTLEERRHQLDIKFMYGIMCGPVDSSTLTFRLLYLYTPLRQTRHTPRFHTDSFYSQYATNSAINRFKTTCYYFASQKVF